MRLTAVIVVAAGLSPALAVGQEKDDAVDADAIYIVPNFHPASCGWLTDFSQERNYCANSYLDHLDRVAADPSYAFVISEVNNMVAIRNFAPERFEELKGRIQEGRVEAVNAFFLESTICLSGGEALVKQGVEGLRWQEAVLGVRPRHLWAIDVTGMHEQMPQIAAGLGLDTLVHCRMNNFGSTLYWGQSPDGSRVLTVSPGHYNEWEPLFRTEGPVSDDVFQGLVDYALRRKRKTSLADVPTMRTPDGAATLILGGSGDYSLAPLYRQYPAEFLEQWQQAAPEHPLRFTTFSDYVDAIMPAVQSGAIAIPTVTGGWNFTYNAFWIQNPTVKQGYRSSEHALLAAEMLATIASLEHGQPYPAQDLYDAWLLMLLNMDRNTLWGAAGGMVFEDAESWDVNDRFDWVDATCERVNRQNTLAVQGDGAALTLFNSANWPRTDPVRLSLRDGQGLEGVACQVLPDGSTLCRPPQPSLGFADFNTQSWATRSVEATLPPMVETEHYTAVVDPSTGDLVSLKVKPTGEELLSGPANVLVAETRPNGKASGDHVENRPERKRLAASSEHPAQVSAFTGPLATIVEARSPFIGGKEIHRVITFYHEHPRIDFDTYLEDIPDAAIVVAEFPLAPRITEVRRGIPYGFAHGAWPEPIQALNGYMKGIHPAVQWSHYTLDGGGGVAILDRGLTGREVDGNTPLVFLVNAVDEYRGYPCPWLSGKGRQHMQYALFAHERPWSDARVPQAAWEYNNPPVVVAGTSAAGEQTFLQTSPNVIVHAMRREGDDIELRLAECFGQAGEATVTVNLPHESAALTDLVGQRREPLSGGPDYRFPVRPQEIVTLRLHTRDAAPAIVPRTDWEDLVPEHKRPALRAYDPAVKGHPPHGQAATIRHDLTSVARRRLLIKYSQRSVDHQLDVQRIRYAVAVDVARWQGMVAGVQPVGNATAGGIAHTFEAIRHTVAVRVRFGVELVGAHVVGRADGSRSSQKVRRRDRQIRIRINPGIYARGILAEAHVSRCFIEEQRRRFQVRCTPIQTVRECRVVHGKNQSQAGSNQRGAHV